MGVGKTNVKVAKRIWKHMFLCMHLFLLLVTCTSIKISFAFRYEVGKLFFSSGFCLNFILYE